MADCEINEKISSTTELLNNSVKKPIRIIEPPNWDPCLKNIDPGKPLYRRLLHWGPLLAIGIIIQVIEKC